MPHLLLIKALAPPQALLPPPPPPLPSPQLLSRPHGGRLLVSNVVRNEGGRRLRLLSADDTLDIEFLRSNSSARGGGSDGGAGGKGGEIGEWSRMRGAETEEGVSVGRATCEAQAKQLTSTADSKYLQ